MKRYMKEIKCSIIAILFFVILVCGLYPVSVWGLANLLFPHKANGSLILLQGKVTGSLLLAQNFSGELYFHPRPSAAGSGYEATSSGGTNLGPISKKLIDSVSERVAAYRIENGLPPGTAVPADAVTASASGLDPHISPLNARIQAQRVARARGLDIAVVVKKIETYTEPRTFGFLGEPRVNVLMLNLDLDGRL